MRLSVQKVSDCSVEACSRILVTHMQCLFTPLVSASGIFRFYTTGLRLGRFFHGSSCLHSCTCQFFAAVEFSVGGEAKLSITSFFYKMSCAYACFHSTEMLVI